MLRKTTLLVSEIGPTSFLTRTYFKFGEVIGADSVRNRSGGESLVLSHWQWANTRCRMDATVTQPTTTGGDQTLSDCILSSPILVYPLIILNVTLLFLLPHLLIGYQFSHTVTPENELSWYPCSGRGWQERRTSKMWFLSRDACDKVLTASTSEGTPLFLFALIPSYLSIFYCLRKASLTDKPSLGTTRTSGEWEFVLAYLPSGCTHVPPPPVTVKHPSHTHSHMRIYFRGSTHDDPTSSCCGESAIPVKSKASGHLALVTHRHG